MNDMTRIQSDPRARMMEVLDRQKAAFLRDGPPDLAARLDRLDRCVGLLRRYEDQIVKALADDFGHRSHDASRLTDVAGSIAPFHFARSRLKGWMKTQPRAVDFPLGLFGAKAEIQIQPKGVVGVIAPWNFPVNLTFTPLAGILAAGNRAMIKPSEFTPKTSDLMAEMFESAFTAEEIAVITGGADVGAAFASLPFDHLLFTGATSIAKHVMRAAAENLVPVTLELGGKSPVIISRTADIPLAAKRIMMGKTLNAGQICLAPDYVLVPSEKQSEFVEAAKVAVAAMYPSIKDNPDYTSMINQRHYDRVMGYVEDAKAKGADVVTINPANEDFRQQEHRRIPPTLILNPTEDMRVMQEEIFGPVMPVKTYVGVNEAVAYVNAKDRPLGLYYFGQDKAEEAAVLANTTSGGATVNDVIFHVAQEDLPFGGVGPSGMGSYHGREGFFEFSHKKAVYTQVKPDLTAMMRPPFTDKMRAYVSKQIGN